MRALAGAFIACAGVWAAADQPTPTGLAETVEKRLVQLDVAIEGDREAIRGITVEDLVLYVGEHEVQGLIVDRLCGDTPPSPESGMRDDQPAETITPSRATFIVFFDQPHLTMAGRALSLEITRELINQLVVAGSRASIVSNARRLETIVAMTGDREKLLEGLERLRHNPRQLDWYAETERKRFDEPMNCHLAKVYALEEWQEAKQSTERIGFTVGALAEVPAPKALVYFGDNLRQTAGLLYLRSGCSPECDGSATFASAEMVPSAAAEFDALITEALTRGVHFFTIQAEGLTASFPGLDTERHRHAQDALVALAAETGGEAFLGGASRDYIAGRIAARTSCSLLLSFPPGELPQDKPLAVRLELHVPEVTIQTQSSIVVPSQASIESARLLAAFVDPTSSNDGSLRVLLIPRGGDGKTWKASVQLRLRPSGLPDSSAELGASIVRGDKVQDHFASSIATKSGSRTMVLEKNLDFAPGKLSVVAVARDAKRGDIGSLRLDADWPSPAQSTAVIAPIAVLQTSPAAMSKDGALSVSGSLARDPDESIDPSINISLTSVVCRGGKTNAPIVVERWLEDGLANQFAPVTIAETDDPCVQTVDVVRVGRLRPGVVDYRVTARVGDEIVAQERRTLRVGMKP